MASILSSSLIKKCVQKYINDLESTLDQRHIDIGRIVMDMVQHSIGYTKAFLREPLVLSLIGKACQKIDIAKCELQIFKLKVDYVISYLKMAHNVRIIFTEKTKQLIKRTMSKCSNPVIKMYLTVLFSVEKINNMVAIENEFDGLILSEDCNDLKAILYEFKSLCCTLYLSKNDDGILKKYGLIFKPNIYDGLKNASSRNTSESSFSSNLCNNLFEEPARCSRRRNIVSSFYFENDYDDIPHEENDEAFACDTTGRLNDCFTDDGNDVEVYPEETDFDSYQYHVCTNDEETNQDVLPEGTENALIPYQEECEKPETELPNRKRKSKPLRLDEREELERKRKSRGENRQQELENEQNHEVRISEEQKEQRKIVFQKELEKAEHRSKLKRAAHRPRKPICKKKESERESGRKRSQKSYALKKLRQSQKNKDIANASQSAKALVRNAENRRSARHL